jgi:hypothetical protein
MTPTLMGRFQTRIFLAATVGVLWTAAITPALPRPAGMSSTFAYHVTFEALGLMTLLGLGWEVVYHVLQQARWDKDWPSVFALLVVVIEAIPLWYVTHILDVIPGTTRLSSPIIPLYVIHVGTTWLLTWLFMQGPLRVLHIRWRFEGGRVLVRAPGRLRRRSNWPNIAAGDAAEAGTAGARATGAGAAGAGADAVAARTTAATAASPGPGEAARRAAVEADPEIATEPGTRAKGVLCGNGHFSHPDARYCAVCGSTVLPLTGPSQVGRRLPAGVLILADGRTVVLDHDLTVTASGPSGDLGFLPAGEHPRTVAHIKLVGWQPVVTSPVRTMSLFLPGGSSLRIEPNVPAPLVPGAELALGEHQIRYESPHYGQYLSLTPDVTAGSPGLAMAAGAKPGRAGPKPGRAVPRRRLAAPLAAAAGTGTLSGTAARPGWRSRRAAAAWAVTATLVAAVMVGFAGWIAHEHGSAGQLPAGLAPAPAPASEPAAPGTQPSHARKRPGSGASGDRPALTAAAPTPGRGRPPHPVPTSTSGQPSRPPSQPPTPPPTGTPSPTPTGSPSPTPTPTKTPDPGSCLVKISLGPVKLWICPPPVRGEL